MSFRRGDIVSIKYLALPIIRWKVDNMFTRISEILTRKEIADDKKDVELEKGDFLALAIAAGSFMLPVLFMIFLFIAVLVLVVF